MRATPLLPAALLASFLALAGGEAIAAGTPVAPAATPARKAAPPAPEPEKDECSATSPEDGGVIASARAGDYQACLREVRSAVSAKRCDGTRKQVPFVFRRTGHKAITLTAVCR